VAGSERRERHRRRIMAGPGCLRGVSPRGIVRLLRW
jgi:hypothetical protein